MDIVYLQFAKNKLVSTTVVYLSEDDSGLVAALQVVYLRAVSGAFFCSGAKETYSN